MKTLDLSKVNTSKILSARKVFFIGIGGIGISAIARMFYLDGKKVLGSNMESSIVTDELQKLGIEVTIGQGLKFIPTDTDLIVYTTAIEKYDEDLYKKIKAGKVPALSYPEMLGIVTKGKYTIAISGTHGKTTTTAMIGKMLKDTGRDPSVIVGTLLPESNSNLVVGKSEYFVVEACEYKRAFLNIHPKILVITNIEPDHLDYYKDLTDIQSAFKELTAQSEKVIADYQKYLPRVPKLLVPGVHNRMNAAAALAVADMLGINLEDAKKSLASFKGTWRRLEKRGETPDGTIIYDDYAHHPTEIKASLQGLRELYPEKQIIVVFQPHLYSRTKALFDDFAKSFAGADQVLLLPIYFAREEPDPTISSEKLSKAIGGTAKAFLDFESAEKFVKNMDLGKNTVLITMGAGEAFKVADAVFTLVK